MEGADLGGAQMEGTDLSYSLLTGRPDAVNLLQSTDLSAGINNGGALRSVDLRPASVSAETRFDLAFLDGSVALHPEMPARGTVCNWLAVTLEEDAAFFGAWRAWVEALGSPWDFCPSA